VTESSPKTVLFVDVRDSARLYETMGDIAAETIIRRSIAVCDRHIRTAGGRVVKNLGDGLMALFGDAAAAVAAAQEIQLELSKQGMLRLAVGLHAGQFIEKDGDIYGDVVNVASRLCSLARAGEILASTESTRHVPASLYANLQDIDAFFVKGRREPVRVVKVYWDRTPDETVYLLANKQATLRSLTIEVASRSYVVGPGMVELTVGRTDADVILAHQMVSRRHAVIKYSGGRFTLTDQSLNGTYIQYRTGQEVVVRREAVDVIGSGAIGFGNPPSVDATRVLFGCS
jgi:hypothetical protein